MQNKTSSVKKFHESFKIGYNNSPVADLGKEKHKLRFDLMAEENNEYVKKLFEDLFKEGIKCEMDLRNEKINYKVREHSLAKIPFIIVCGKKEVAENTVTVRKLGSDKQEVIKRNDFIKNMLDSNKLPLN